MTKTDFIVSMFEAGVLKFGSFTLKSGITSPFYLNLRQFISYPDLMQGISRLLADVLPPALQYERIAGVPYTGIPLASALSLHLNKPLIIPRKEEKAYGSKDAIMGEYSQGDRCLLVEDLVTSGESILETRQQMIDNGLNPIAGVVLVDRRAVKDDFAKNTGLPLYAVTNIEEIIQVLMEKGLMSNETAKEIQMFLMNSSMPKAVQQTAIENASTASLLQTMQRKQSNLVLSLDVDTEKEFFAIVEQCGKHIAMLKTHIDILADFSPAFINRLQEAAKAYDFKIFEDRKFADIGNTVRMQYRGGIYKIADWSEFVTVHAIAGEAILNGLFDGLANRSSFLLARMSAKNNLISENYTRKVLEIGKNNRHVVSGFIGHGKDEKDIRLFKNKIPAGMLLLMPGVQMESKGDGLGQQYITPEMAVRGGADMIIVGRGITHAASPAEASERYRETAWNELSKLI
ncbi:MAG: orotidine-5'-phosphate decarboxylase [Ignavibacteriales bacterium]|nr:orotidine-5'-phosphate decarboxylase [Ignavibacteriales bacterium]